MSTLRGVPRTPHGARKIVLRVVASLALLVILLLAAAGLKLWPPLGGRITGARKERVRASPNWRDGSFVNLVPTHKLLPGTVWKTVYREFVGDEHRVPTGARPGSAMRRSSWRSTASRS